MRGPLLLAAGALLAGAACSSSSSPTGLPPHQAYDSLPVTAATVHDAAAAFAHDPDSVFASCSGTTPVNCAGGMPGAPVLVTVVRTGDTVAATGPDSFAFTARVKLVTQADIPVQVPVAGACGVAINTAPGTDSVIAIHGRAIFGRQSATGPIDRVDVLVDSITLLTANDIALSGGAGCTSANPGLGFFIGLVRNNVLPPDMHLCGAPGAAEFVACTPGVPLASPLGANSEQAGPGGGRNAAVPPGSVRLPPPSRVR